MARSRGASAVLAWVCALSSSLALGCLSSTEVPAAGPRIEHLELLGAESIDTDELREGLATQEASSWTLDLGESTSLDERVLERDLQRIERYYRARGYYEAKVTAARVITSGEDEVRVEIVVSEGPPVRIAAGGGGRIAVQINGLESIDDARTVAAIIAESPRPGAVLDERDYSRAKARMQRVLADRGYAFAAISGRVDVDLAQREALVRFDIDAGNPASFGAIVLEGLEQVPEDKVRDSLSIQSGERYSAAALEDARRALVNLGVFASVAVEVDTDDPEAREVPVKFTLREAAPRTLRLGGGARLDAIELSANLTAGWEHRNFLGGLRHLSLEARPGVVLFPTRMSDFPDLAPPDRALLQGSLEARLAQPSFLENRIRGFSSAALQVQPLLYSDTPVNAPLFGFLEVATRAGLERPFLSHRLFIGLSLNWLAELPLDYGQLSLGGRSPPASPSAIEKLFIAYPELATRLDYRDDPIDPRNGFLLSNSLQAALPVLGGSVSDLRLHPEARFYVTKKRLTFASRASTGLLFPGNYFPSGAERGAETAGVSTSDQQILLFRGFFSGGPFSNRGYAFQGVGGREPFLPSNDPGVPCSSADPNAFTDPRCLRPIGGLTSWELSVELRFPIRFLSPLGAVLFLDASDVRQGRAEYGFDTPHLAPGLGLRYPTPIGPIRLDLGFRVLEALNEEEPEGNPPTLFGAPVALHLAVGQAF